MLGQQRPGAENIATAVETALKPEAASDETTQGPKGDKGNARGSTPESNSEPTKYPTPIESKLWDDIWRYPSLIESKLWDDIWRYPTPRT